MLIILRAWRWIFRDFFMLERLVLPFRYTLATFLITFLIFLFFDCLFRAELLPALLPNTRLITLVEIVLADVSLLASGSTAAIRKTKMTEKIFFFITFEIY